LGSIGTLFTRAVVALLETAISLLYRSAYRQPSHIRRAFVVYYQQSIQSASD